MLSNRDQPARATIRQLLEFEYQSLGKSPSLRNNHLLQTIVVCLTVIIYIHVLPELILGISGINPLPDIIR